MTRTDSNGVTHQMVEIPSTLRDTFYKPIMTAAENGRREQEKLEAMFRTEGMPVRPIAPEVFDEPEVFFACNPLVWASRDRLDPEPKPVNCIDCLAVKEDR